MKAVFACAHLLFLSLFIEGAAFAQAVELERPETPPLAFHRVAVGPTDICLSDYSVHIEAGETLAAIFKYSWVDQEDNFVRAEVSNNKGTVFEIYSLDDRGTEHERLEETKLSDGTSITLRHIAPHQERYVVFDVGKISDIPASRQYLLPEGAEKLNLALISDTFYSPNIREDKEILGRIYNKKNRPCAVPEFDKVHLNRTLYINGPAKVCREGIMLQIKEGEALATGWPSPVGGTDTFSLQTPYGVVGIRSQKPEGRRFGSFIVPRSALETLWDRAALQQATAARTVERKNEYRFAVVYQLEDGPSGPAASLKVASIDGLRNKNRNYVGEIADRIQLAPIDGPQCSGWDLTMLP